MTMANKIASFFARSKNALAKQTAWPPTLKSLKAAFEQSVQAIASRQSSSQNKEEAANNCWSPSAGYRTIVLEGLRGKEDPTKTAAKPSEPLSEPPPLYSDGLFPNYIPEDKDYAASLGSPFYCCSIFDEIAPQEYTQVPVKQKPVESEPKPPKIEKRVLTLLPTEAMEDDPKGNIYAPLRPGAGGPDERNSY